MKNTKFKNDMFLVKKIILHDGREIDCDTTPHVGIFNTKISDKEYYTDITFLMNSEIDCKEMSNRCFMLAVVFNHMQKYNLTYMEAVEIYDKYIKDSRDATINQIPHK